MASLWVPGQLPTRLRPLTVVGQLLVVRAAFLISQIKRRIFNRCVGVFQAGQDGMIRGLEVKTKQSEGNLTEGGRGDRRASAEVIREESWKVPRSASYPQGAHWGTDTIWVYVSAKSPTAMREIGWAVSKGHFCFFPQPQFLLRLSYLASSLPVSILSVLPAARVVFRIAGLIWSLT